MYYFLQLPIRRYGYTSNEPELYSFTVQHRADLWPLRTICTNCFIYVYITTNCFIYVYITTNCFIYVNITTNCFIYVYITTNCFIYVNKIMTTYELWRIFFAVDLVSNLRIHGKRSDMYTFKCTALLHVREYIWIYNLSNRLSSTIGGNREMNQ